jgi:hypothetical protein
MGLPISNTGVGGHVRHYLPQVISEKNFTKISAHHQGSELVMTNIPSDIRINYQQSAQLALGKSILLLDTRTIVAKLYECGDQC